MKKHLLLVLFLTTAIFYSQAQQQIPNSNFEQWENVGSNTEEPIEWNGMKTGEGSLITFAPKTLQRSTAIRPGATGQYCARLYTGSALGNTLQGILTTGRVNVVSTSDAYIYTNTNNAAFNATMTSWPDSLVFWSRYVSGTGSDKALMRAVIHDNFNYQDPPTAASASHVVAELFFEITHSGAAWVRHSVPFSYTGPATSPAFILLSSASNTGTAHNNDQLFLDDIQLIYNPVTTTAINVNPLFYNVSASQGSNISIPFTKTGIFHFGNTFTAQLSDANGSFANPIVLGTLNSTNAGTINGNIPAGTPPGSGYRVRVVATTPYQTANDNGTNITIADATNSIAPTALQTIAANTNGNVITVTEGTPATSRVWKFSTNAGGPYTSFMPNQTGINYTPNFSVSGSYYIICESSFGQIVITSNEVQVNVVQNQVTPAGTQSILTGVNGNLLTVHETPTGGSREWKYAMSFGGPYQSFVPSETDTNYLPLFAASGLYYVVCESQISGLTVTSNQVIFSVGSLQINTGNIVGAPFLFSPSAPAATVQVPFTVNQPFNPGNIFTAELSDANGSFATPTVIGTLAGENSDTIMASIPSNTPAGNGYLIRVTGTNLIVSGTDNGVPLSVDQFHNSISPNTPQTIPYGVAGNPLTVAESQNIMTREWRASSVSGGPYSPIAPAQNSTTYAPQFFSPGTYYVICASVNTYGDEVISNEVAITVNNGTELHTGTIVGSPFYVSPSSQVVIDVPVSTNVQFAPNNVFTVELSSVQGVFNPTTIIGSLSGALPVGLTATIPSNTPSGSLYRVRVVSSSPAINGTDNGSDLTIIGYEAHATPNDTQYVSVLAPVPPISFTCTHPFMNVEWKIRDAFGTYTPFVPAQTGQVFGPYNFMSIGNFTVVGIGINQWGDIIHTEDVVFVVGESPANIEENGNGVKAYLNGNQFIVDLSSSAFMYPDLQIINMAGQIVMTQKLQGQTIQTISVELAAGVYTYKISEGGRYAVGKILKH